MNEKAAFVHTAARSVIDLRKSKTEATLQATSFPEAPAPTCTVANILQLQNMQRFDPMAIPAKIIDRRTSATSLHIADVRLLDGSKEQGLAGKEHCYATLPLTLFFKSAGDLQ